MLVYGKQVFLYILDNHKGIIKKIYLSKDIDKKLFRKISLLNKPIIKLDNKKAQSLARGGNHQGFFVEIDEFCYINYSELLNKKFIVILDNVTDMGNIGSIARTAYAFGVDALVITKIKGIKIENIIRSSSGGVLDLPVANIYDIKDLINRLKQHNFRLVGASLVGDSLSSFKKNNKKLALVVGNEHSGITKSIEKYLEKYKIDMKNRFDSLNVAIATSLFIYKLSE